MSNADKLAINTIRVLAAEAIQKANSGHPGLVLGSAPMAWTLWSKQMKMNPADPNWENRDRFILSAGHGSMLLYSLLHIFGYGLSMEEIKNFRQWGSLTPGHPEYRHTPGVEATSGPLGQGIAMGVGMALAEANLAAKFNKPGYEVVNHHTYVLAGDGCLQEGVSAEASSFAGSLGLGKLIVLYDKNDITIEGNIDVTFTEKVRERYLSYGWQVLEVEDGNADLKAIDKAIRDAKEDTHRPSLIIVKTKIAYGCPNKEGTAASHGSPLGEENIAAMKKEMGWDYPEFTVPDEVKKEVEDIRAKLAEEEEQWKEMYKKYAAEYPDLCAEYNKANEPVDPKIFDNEEYWTFEDKPAATRASSGTVLNKLSKMIPNLIGGSADLAPANNTVMKDREYLSKDDMAGSNIHFGIREFGMAAITNGMKLHGRLTPYCATFLVFSDYMRGAVRMSALMSLPVTYIFTHDSIGVGEDGPTHEPIEQLASLRAMPNLYTWRPADNRETAAAYQFAMTADAPNALCFSRQNVPQLDGTGKEALKGAYILKDVEGKLDAILIATGTEVSLCVEAAQELEKQGIKARVVSMPCMEQFEAQDDSYKQSVLPDSVAARVVVEAGTSFGWAKYSGTKGEIISIDHFGASAPAATLYKEFGFTTDRIVAAVKDVVKKA